MNLPLTFLDMKKFPKIDQNKSYDRLVSDLVGEDIDWSEAGRGIGAAEQVRRAELGHDARMRGEAHAADRRQPHRHPITTTALQRVEVQPGMQSKRRFIFRYTSFTTQGKIY